MRECTWLQGQRRPGPAKQDFDEKLSKHRKRPYVKDYGLTIIFMIKLLGGHCTREARRRLFISESSTWHGVCVCEINGETRIKRGGLRAQCKFITWSFCRSYTCAFNAAVTQSIKGLSSYAIADSDGDNNSLSVDKFMLRFCSS